MAELVSACQGRFRWRQPDAHAHKYVAQVANSRHLGYGMQGCIHVALPFGQARVALKRDFGSCPSAKPSLQPPEERMVMLAQLRCLLCIEVTVELSKFYYTDNSGLDLQLPRDCQLWKRSAMPQGPVAIIWNRFHWESWLQAELLGENDEVEPEGFQAKAPLAWEMQEVATAYFDGGYLPKHPQIDGNPKKFEKYREALIARAGIDILNPWNVAQLNLGQALSREFMLEKRFLPQVNEVFAPHTLAQQTVGPAILKLDAAMQGKPGWSFEHPLTRMRPSNSIKSRGNRVYVLPKLGLPCSKNSPNTGFTPWKNIKTHQPAATKRLPNRSTSSLLLPEYVNPCEIRVCARPRAPREPSATAATVIP